MKYRAVCPNCGEAQSRWSFTSPLIGMTNECLFCNCLYRSSWQTNLLGFILGIPIAVAIILVLEHKLLPWPITFLSIIGVLVIFSALSPFLTKLKAVKNQGMDPVSRWLKPFLLNQICIALLLLLQLFYFFLSNKVMNSYGETFVKFRNSLDSIESLEVMRKSSILNSDLFTHFLSYTIGSNRAFTVNVSMTLLLVMFTSSFYFKMRALKSMRQKQTKDSETSSRQ